MEDETLELRVDVTDADFKKLEKGKALVLAHGIIGSAPIQIVIQRKKKPLKTKLEWKDSGIRRDGKVLRTATLVEDTDNKKILSLIPDYESARRREGKPLLNLAKKREDIIAEASERWHIDADKANVEIDQMGTIYEPREGFFRKTQRISFIKRPRETEKMESGGPT
jgi:hypothetical protein